MQTKQKHRFTIPASSSYNTTQYNCHSVTLSDDRVNEWTAVGGATSYWIKIGCPLAVAIWKFIVRGRYSGTERFLVWKLEGSNDDVNWSTLYYTISTPIGLTPIEISLLTASPTKYIFYRLFFTRYEVGNPGLSYWQLFSLDDLV